MPFSHEGSGKKIQSLMGRLGWKAGKQSRFHDWLGKAYPSEKDSMSEQELYKVAQEFARDDRDQRDD